MTPPDFPLSLPWIDRLVRFDTTSRLSNLGLVETVRDHLATAGHSPRLFHNAEQTKACLLYTSDAADE